jgi:hypothetical protein
MSIDRSERDECRLVAKTGSPGCDPICFPVGFFRKTLQAALRQRNNWLFIEVDSMSSMSEEVQVKDRFWMYVGCAVFVIVTGILMVKQSENEKYAPIKQLADDEKASMNIRVLKDF